MTDYVVEYVAEGAIFDFFSDEWHLLEDIQDVLVYSGATEVQVRFR